jgi:hypothetical protein
MQAVTQNLQRNPARVLRFEFSDALIEHVAAFAKLHQYDDRKTYKEAWAAWLANDEIAALLKADVKRLTDLGYNGDVADKLFKSGRYYFRQKTAGFPNLSLHADPMCPKQVGVWDVPIALVAPRKYVLMNRDLLNAMDDHIERGLRQDENDADADATAYTPAKGFADFYKTWAAAEVDTLRKEVERLSEIMPSGEAVHDKLKKTYKNRYFMIVRH